MTTKLQADVESSQRDEAAPAAGLMLDLPAVIARLGGDVGFAAECVDLLEAELPEMLSALRDAMSSGSAEAVNRAAHALKGAAGNFYPGGATATAAEIDRLSRQGDVRSVRPLLPVIERELEALTMALQGLKSPAVRK